MLIYPDRTGVQIGTIMYEQIIKRGQTREEKAEIALSILEYAFEHKEVTDNFAAQVIVDMAKPYLHKNERRYANGLQGGAPESNQNAIKQPKSTKNNQNQPNNNNNNNNIKDKIKDNVNTNSEKLFERVWQHYPKKECKEKARQVWFNINPDTTLARTMAHKIDEFAESANWKESDYKYVPQFHKWLADERWNDEVPKTPEVMY